MSALFLPGFSSANAAQSVLRSRYYASPSRCLVVLIFWRKRRTAPNPANFGLAPERFNVEPTLAWAVLVESDDTTLGVAVTVRAQVGDGCSVGVLGLTAAPRLPGRAGLRVGREVK